MKLDFYEFFVLNEDFMLSGKPRTFFFLFFWWMQIKLNLNT